MLRTPGAGCASSRWRSNAGLRCSLQRRRGGSAVSADAAAQQRPRDSKTARSRRSSPQHRRPQRSSSALFAVHCRDERLRHDGEDVGTGKVGGVFARDSSASTRATCRPAGAAHPWPSIFAERRRSTVRPRTVSRAWRLRSRSSRPSTSRTSSSAIARGSAGWTVAYEPDARCAPPILVDDRRKVRDRRFSRSASGTGCCCTGFTCHDIPVVLASMRLWVCILLADWSLTDCSDSILRMGPQSTLPSGAVARRRAAAAAADRTRSSLAGTIGDVEWRLICVDLRPDERDT